MCSTLRLTVLTKYQGGGGGGGGGSKISGKGVHIYKSVFWGGEGGFSADSSHFP